MYEKLVTKLIIRWNLLTYNKSLSVSKMQNKTDKLSLEKILMMSIRKQKIQKDLLKKSYKAMIIEISKNLVLLA